MVPAQEAIHVVVPSWQGRAHLELLLESLAGQTLRPASILIVDGGSNDGSAEVARNSGAGFLDLGRNLGFAHAVNRGIAALPGSSRIAVLNNDLRLAPDWLEQISRIDAPFVTGKVLAWNSPSRIDATWDLLSQSGIPMRAGHGKADGFFWNQPRQILLAPWTAILIRPDYWQATGGLDESFESYLEDVDIGLRGLGLGFRGHYQPSAVAWHKGSSTLGAWHPRQVRLTSRNQLRLIARHGSSNWWKVLVGQALWGFAAARHGCFGPWLTGKRQALADFRRPPTPSTLPPDEFENEIFDINSQTGFERFWLWYWALTS